jgi:hypothetical protein
MSAAAPGGGGERPNFGVARLAEETRERFVREMIARVPLSRLVELYLFSPMRQGGMESGVAVLAATLDLPPEPVGTAEVAAPVAPLAAADADAAVATADDVSTAASLATLPEPPALEPAPDAAVDPVPDGDPTELAAGAAPEAGGIIDADAPGTDVVEGGEDAPVLDDATGAAVDAEPVDPPEAALAAVLEVVPERAPEAAPRPVVRRRLTVFTARYRLVIKGPDRGKWDVEVREEADAPLVTVEAVVRGVQQRAGDASEPERLDAAGVARLLGVPLPESGGAPAP